LNGEVEDSDGDLLSTRRSKGERGMVGLGGGHGGKLGLLGGFTGEREHKRKMEGGQGIGRKGGGGGVASRCISRGSFSVLKRQAGGGEVGIQGASTQLLHEEDKSYLQIAPGFGEFSRKK
jgi:hypothetical protein